FSRDWSSDVCSSDLEAGTGYFKTSIAGSDVRPEMGHIEVEISGSDAVQARPSWGGVYWQYFEDLDKITFSETPLKLQKQLFITRSEERRVGTAEKTE